MCRRLLFIATAIVVLFGAWGCKSDASHKKPTIVATTGFAAEICKVIFEDDCKVVQLMGPGVDPHLFKPAIADIQQLYNADLIVCHGLHLEGKMSQIFEELGTKRKIITLGECFAVNQLIFHNSTQPDPHFWFDLAMWAQASRYFSQRASQLGFISDDVADARLKPYTKEIMETDGYIRKEVNNIASTRRYLVSTHDAFSYYGRAYGLQVKSLQGISTVAEFGLRDIKSIVDFMTTSGVSVIFSELSTPTQPIKAIAEGVKARGQKLTIGGSLFTDALGAKGSSEQTLAGAARYNTKLITTNLYGQHSR